MRRREASAKEACRPSAEAAGTAERQPPARAIAVAAISMSVCSSASAGIVAFSNITTRTCKSAARIVVDAQHSPDGPRGSRRPRNSASAHARAGPRTQL